MIWYSDFGFFENLPRVVFTVFGTRFPTGNWNQATGLQVNSDNGFESVYGIVELKAKF